MYNLQPKHLGDTKATDWTRAPLLHAAGEVKPAFDAAAVQAELRSARPDVVAAAQAFSISVSH